jgi:peptidoglycan/LPS O-acetylase OafA/YrhL
MPPDPAARDRMDSLDVARGAAALLVVADHGLQQCVPGYLGWSRDHVHVSAAGVLVFFLVSGFVVPMSREAARSGAAFWVRRLFRLFPVYWLSLALAAAYLAAAGAVPLGVALSDTATWAANAGMVQNLAGRPHVWGVYWTLPYEFLIYGVCWALFAAGLLGRVGWRVAAALLAGFVVMGVWRPLVGGKAADVGGLRQVVLVSALFGFLAYRHVTGKLSRRALYGLVAGWFAGAVVVWAVNHARFPEAATAGQLARFGCLWGLAFGFFFGLVELRRRPMPGALCWLGRHCYPVYLLHPLVLILLIPTGWPVAAFMACLVAATLALAAAAHRWVERPGIALGRRAEKGLRAPAAGGRLVRSLAALVRAARSPAAR